MDAIVRAVIGMFLAGGLVVSLPTVESPAEASFGGSQPVLTVPRTTVPTPPVTHEYLDNTIQNCQDVTRIMLKEGWPASELAYGTEIAWRESRCMPWQLNPYDAFGGSIGLFQINRFWCLPNRYSKLGYLQEQGVLEDCDDLYNATLNIRAALAIWEYAEAKHGNGWRPWATAKDSK